MSLQQDCGSRHLINLPGFYAHQSVFDVVNPAYAMPASQFVNLPDNRKRGYISVAKAHRYTFFKPNFQIGGAGRRFFQWPCPQENILGRFVPGMFKDTAFDATAP